MPTALTLADLRHHALKRTMFPPTTLKRAITKLGFVQADPIRAPARAQDLILRHRVKDYRAGDLDRNYVSLDIEEDTFVNYGFVTRELQALMHPRPDVRVPAAGMGAWSAAERKKAELLLKFVESRGEVHPREVEEHFAHGRCGITGAAHRTRPRICSMRCTTAGWCGWCGGRTASASTALTNINRQVL
jgi:uncharacterized protein YcaQ